MFTNLKKTLAASALVLASAGSALAADRVVVTLEQPVAAKTKVIAGGAVLVAAGAAGFGRPRRPRPGVARLVLRSGLRAAPARIGSRPRCGAPIRPPLRASAAPAR